MIEDMLEILKKGYLLTNPKFTFDYHGDHQVYQMTVKDQYTNVFVNVFSYENKVE